MKTTQPFSMILFGATGDLAKRKLFPALFRLYQTQSLPATFSVIGVGRTERSDQQFREQVYQSILTYGQAEQISPSDWQLFVQHFFYVSADVDDEEGYQAIRKRVEQQAGNQNRLFYLAIRPDLFGSVSSHLKTSGLADVSGWKRLIIEKPIGHDEPSAAQLNEEITHSFREDEIYRIDHYLGKEMVQNINVMRFANSLFEPLWNHHYIESVQITASETVGVEDRAGYYDGAGALRDMVQNHLLQMLMMVCMEPPSRLKTEAIHDEKIKVLRSLRRIKPEDVATYFVRGQYQAGKIKDQQVKAYQDEQNIPHKSQTETFVAGKVYVDNLRWAGVPFYLRTGKRLPEKSTEIIIQFKEMPPNLYFNRDNQLGPNLLVICIQPIEGVYLLMNTKKPGTDEATMPVAMNFCNHYDTSHPDAYESLLYDAMNGDQTFFTHWEEVSLAWKFIDPIRRAWDENQAPLEAYTSGTWGPQAAQRLLAEKGHYWYPVGGKRGWAYGSSETTFRNEIRKVVQKVREK